MYPFLFYFFILFPSVVFFELSILIYFSVFFCLALYLFVLNCMGFIKNMFKTFYRGIYG